jgi:parallel beta-helix repeat protein
MKRRITTVGVVASLVIFGLLGFIILESNQGNAASILYVGGIGTGNYTVIQFAINDASPGDTIFVYGNTTPYYEHLTITKSLNLVGEDRETVIIEGNFLDEVIHVGLSANWVTINGFTISNGTKGILLAGVSNNNIYGNKIISNSDNGIYLSRSVNNNISDNIFVNNGIFIEGVQLSHFNSHNIPPNNLVNQKPLYYYKNSTGIDIDNISTGQLILANCSRGNVTNLQINNTDVGIQVAYSSDIDITNNSLTENEYGIHTYSSSGINITNNTILSNRINGLNLSTSSHDNRITNNTVLSNYGNGINLYSSSNTMDGNLVSENYGHGIYIDASTIIIANNTVSSNENDGVYLSTISDSILLQDNIITRNKGNGIYTPSSSNIIFRNEINTNTDFGIYLLSSTNNNISDCEFINNGIFIEGDELSHFNSHEIPTNNIVNSKPLYYYKDSSGLDINAISVGQLILINCTNVQVKSLLINNTDVGIETAYSGFMNITHCNLSNNKYGFYLFSSSNSGFTNNSVSLNTIHGFYLEGSPNNTINSNDVISNSRAGILTYTSPNCTFYNNNLLSNSWLAIRIWSSQNCKINDNNVTYNEHGIIIGPVSSYTLVTGNNASNNNGSGISCGSTYVDISRNKVYSNNRSGIIAHSFNNVTNNNVDSNTEKGISISRESGVLIRYNNITNNSDGISIKTSSDCQIVNNRVWFNDHNGIYLYVSSGNIVSDNNASTNHGCGISLESTANDNTISGNFLLLNNGYGIHIRSSSRNNVIGNIIYSNSEGGLYLRSALWSNITDNIIQSNDNYGIYLLTSLNNNIFNNIVSSNNGYGMHVDNGCKNNNITLNNIELNNDDGIYLYLFSDYNIMDDNIISRNTGHGISINKSHYIDITKNQISSNGKDGIDLYSSSDFNIIDNDINSVKNGISLDSSSRINVNKNNVFDNIFGISLSASQDNTIEDNLILTNDYGIFFNTSSNNNIKRNSIENNGNGIIFDSSSHNDILNNNISQNTWNGIYFWDNSKFNTISNSNLTHNTNGINTSFSEGTIITDNNISNNVMGISQWSSSDGMITNNIIQWNSMTGISLQYTGDVTFVNNSINSNGLNGLYLFSSSRCTISENNIIDNYWGVYLDSCTKISITNNSFTKDGVVIEGSSIPHFNSHTINTDNLVNGKSLYYYKDSNEIDIDDILIGQLIVTNCTRIRSANLTIDNTDIGIQFAYVNSGEIIDNNISENDNDAVTVLFSNDITIKDNTIWENQVGVDVDNCTELSISHNYIHSNDYGIYTHFSNHSLIRENNVSSNYFDGVHTTNSDNITIVLNNITSNGGFGIHLNSSINILVHHNNFIDNSNHSFDDLGEENHWDFGYPFGGNYWDDYAGIDEFSGPSQELLGGDGLGDDPNIIDPNSLDNYPLMEPYLPFVPSNPRNLEASSGDSYVILTWEAPVSSGGSQVFGYRLYRGSASENATFLIEIGNAISYNDTSVINGITYYYKVIAVSPFNEGPFSNEAYATPGSIPSAPIFNAVVSGDSFVQLRWGAPVSDGGFIVTKYRLYRAETPGEMEFLLDLDSLRYNDTNVINGVTYYYRVSAVNEIGEGSLSEEVNEKPLSVPSEPRVLSAKSGDAYINLSWTAPASYGGSIIIRYNIYRGTSPEEQSFLGDTENISYFNDTNVTNAILYYYKISAVNEVGEGALSNYVSAKSLEVPHIVNQPPLCNIIAPIGGATISGTVEISGNASDAEGNISKVEIRIDNDLWILVSGNASWSYDWDTNLVSNGSHKIYARAFDGELYSKEAFINLTVNNQDPNERSEVEETWSPILIALFVLILIIVIILVMKMKKKPNEHILDERNEKGEENENLNVDWESDSTESDDGLP